MDFNRFNYIKSIFFKSRNYEPRHLGQLRRVYPEAFNFRIDDRDEPISLTSDEPTWNLVVEPNLTSDLPEAPLVGAKSPSESPLRVGSANEHASASSSSSPPDDQPVRIRGVLSRLLSPSKALEASTQAALFSPSKRALQSPAKLVSPTPSPTPMRVLHAPPPSPSIQKSAEKANVTAFTASRLLLRKGHFRSLLIDRLQKHHRVCVVILRCVIV